VLVLPKNALLEDNEKAGYCNKDTLPFKREKGKTQHADCGELRL
jgi:hypothetical protein